MHCILAAFIYNVKGKSYALLIENIFKNTICMGYLPVVVMQS